MNIKTREGGLSRVNWPNMGSDSKGGQNERNAPLVKHEIVQHLRTERRL
jgi:hypothetical protein